MDHPLGKPARPGAGEVGEFIPHHAGEAGRNRIGLRFRSGEEAGPRLDRQGVRAAHAEIRTRTMELGERLPEGRAMGDLGRLDPHAVEEGHDRGRPGSQFAERGAAPVLDRQRAGDAARREMLHQPEEERQVARRDTLLVEGQDEVAAPGVQEIIRVLDPLGDPLAGQEPTDVVA